MLQNNTRRKEVDEGKDETRSGYQLGTEATDEDMGVHYTILIFTFEILIGEIKESTKG